MSASYITIINPERYNSHHISIYVKPVDDRWGSIYKYYGKVSIDGVQIKGLFTRGQFRNYGFIFI